MRAAIPLLTAALMAAIPAVSGAFPDGAPWGAANPATNPNCASCHFGDDPVMASPGLTIHGLPKVFVAGTTYDLELVFEDPEIVVSGFQLIAQAPEGDVGTLTSTDSDVEFIGSSIRSIGIKRSNGRASWRIRWHAPKDFCGEVDFYVAASAANDDQSPFGDTIHFVAHRISTHSC